MRRRDGAGALAVAVIAAPVVAGGLYSAAAMLGLTGAGAEGFDIARVTRVVNDPATWQSLLWTLYTAGMGTLLAAAAAVLVSVLLQRSRTGRALLVVPLAVPHAAAALAALLLLAQSGLLSRLAFAAGLVSVPADFPPMVYDKPGVALIVSFAWKEFPFLTLTALAVLDTAGLHLQEVAHTLGAGPMSTFSRVTWPLLWRGIAPPVIAVFAFLVGQYEMAVMLAPSDPLPLSVLTYERAQDPVLARRGEAHALGLLALVIGSALVLLHEWVRRQSAVGDG